MSFTVINHEQGSREWFLSRCGRLTGSRAKDMLAEIKSGEAAARRDLRTQLVCERLTQLDQGPDFDNRWMQRGRELEEEALSMFEAVTGWMVRYAGFLQHDGCMAGCSLDGYLGDFAEIVEVKVPKPAIHLEYVRSGEVPHAYRCQIRHNAWVSGAERAHFVSYGPDWPSPVDVHIVTLERDELEIPEYEEKALEFLAEVDAEVEDVMALLEERREAA